MGVLEENLEQEEPMRVSTSMLGLSSLSSEATIRKSFFLHLDISPCSHHNPSRLDVTTPLFIRDASVPQSHNHRLRRNATVTQRFPVAPVHVARLRWGVCLA